MTTSTTFLANIINKCLSVTALNETAANLQDTAIKAAKDTKTAFWSYSEKSGDADISSFKGIL